MTVNTFVAALEYAQAGLRVVQLHGLRTGKVATLECDCWLQRDKGVCNPKQWGKHPRGKAWQERATWDQDQLKAWWRKHPGSNVGLACGATAHDWALVVLDVDGEPGERSLEQLLIEHGQELPQTWEVRSGRADGGRHLYWRAPVEVGLRNRGKMRDGLDVRGQGGQVVAPPSLHHSGRRYTSQMPFALEAIAAMPDWLIDLIKTPPQPKASPRFEAPPDPGQIPPYVEAALRRAERELSQMAPQSGRHTRLWQEVASLGRYAPRYVSEGTVIWRLKQAALQSGLREDEELEHQLRSGLQKARDDGPLEIPEPTPRQRPSPRPPGVTRGAPTTGSSGGQEPPGDPPQEPPAQAPDGEEPFFSFRACTDVGNRDRFLEAWGQDLRYVPTFKRWFIWHQERWKEDEGELQEMAIQTARSIRDEARGALEAGAKAEAEILSRHAHKSEGHAAIGNMISLARSHPGVRVRHAALDADPLLLGVANGLLDLRTGELRAARREDLVTRQCPVPYLPQASCPTWLRFLLDVMKGREELVEFLRRAIGYCLTGLTSEQVLFFFQGAGRNGKGTLMETLLDLLGRQSEEEAGYGAVADFNTFLEQNNTGPRNDLAALRGARLVTASEPGKGKRLAEGFVKSVTGADTVTARKLYGEPFSFRPNFKLILAANDPPQVRGTDHGIWRRILMVPFEVRYVTAAEVEQGLEGPPVDYGLQGRLRQELPGILAWAVRGCMDWQVDGLCPPAAVMEATAQYRAQNDVVGQFIEARCVAVSQARVSAGALYQAFSEWCEESGIRSVPTQAAFGAEIAGRGFVRHRQSSGYRYDGLGLRALD
jgi:putative DNA primase/helicase